MIAEIDPDRRGGPAQGGDHRRLGAATRVAPSRTRRTRTAGWL